MADGLPNGFNAFNDLAGGQAEPLQSSPDDTPPMTLDELMDRIKPNDNPPLQSTPQGEDPICIPEQEKPEDNICIPPPKLPPFVGM